MRGAVIASLLVIALLVFGCGAKAQSNATANASANVSTGGLPPGAPPAQPPAQPPPQPPPQPPQGNDSGATGGTGGTGGTSEGNQFAGMDYAALIALGLPVQCDVTSGGAVSRMYMVEAGKKVRIESSSDECAQSILIIKDNKMYMKCEDEPMFPGCDWIEFELSGGAGGGASGGAGSTTSNIQDAPSSSFNCDAWLSDESKFETAGNVCNLQDMYGGQ